VWIDVKIRVLQHFTHFVSFLRGSEKVNWSSIENGTCLFCCSKNAIRVSCLTCSRTWNHKPQNGTENLDCNIGLTPPKSTFKSFLWDCYLGRGKGPWNNWERHRKRKVVWKRVEKVDLRLSSIYKRKWKTKNEVKLNYQKLTADQQSTSHRSCCPTSFLKGKSPDSMFLSPMRLNPTYLKWTVQNLLVHIVFQFPC